MPRRRAAAAPPVREDDEELEPLPPEREPVSPEMDSLMDFLERAGDRAESVALFELNPDTNEQEFLERMPKEAFSFDVLRDKYGGGRYIVMALSARNRIVSRETVTISKRILAKGAADTTAAAAAATRPGADPAAYLALATMQGQQKGLEAMAASQAQILGAVLAAFGRERGEKSNGDSDPLDVGLRIAEIIKGASAPTLGVEELVKTFREGLSMGTSMGGGEGGFWEAVKPLVPAVADTLKEAVQTDRARAARALPAGAPARAPAAAPSTTTGEQAMDLTKAPWLAHLTPFVAEIAGWAQRGWDAQALAIAVAARLPEPSYKELALAATRADFVTASLDALPAPYQTYRAYLTEFVEALQEEVLPEEDATATVEGV